MTATVRLLAVGIVGIGLGYLANRVWPHDHASTQVTPKHRDSGDNHDHGPGDDRDHDRNHEPRAIALSAESAARHGITVAEAAPGELQTVRELPAEVKINENMLAHVVPAVTGIVREVAHNVGDRVRAGEVLMVLDSRELADAKAADVAATSRLELARTNLTRSEKLFADEKIMPEKQVIAARQALAEAEIEHRLAEARLHALGLSEAQVEAIHTSTDQDYKRYEIRAPFDGTILAREAAVGEAVATDSRIFDLADLTTVWIDMTVYPQDLAHVRPGGDVTFSVESADQPVRATIAAVSPIVDPATRTGMARCVVDNPDGRWRPGTFVQARVVLARDSVALAIPSSAIQTLEGQAAVFVATPTGFEPRSIVLGRSDGAQHEVLSGLSPGDRFAARGAFVLKAELLKSSAAHQH